MRRWTLAVVGTLALGSTACIDDVVEDAICRLDCLNKSFVRIEPPFERSGDYVLSIDSEKLRGSCRVRIPLESAVTACELASTETGWMGGVNVWAHDDDSTDLGGVTLPVQPAKVRIQVKEGETTHIDQEVELEFRDETGSGCECHVGRAVVGG